MKALIANVVMSGRTGTEVVTEEFLRGLARRGAQVAGYSPVAGDRAEALRRDGVPFVDAIDQIPFAPDVIHANHFAVAAPLLIAFPDTPMVVFCHDAGAWHDTPFDAPAIRRFVAVDLRCRRRILDAVPDRAGDVTVLHNAVDLDRFVPRDALPAAPRRALIMAKNLGHIEPIEQACAARGIETTVLGTAVDRVVADLDRRFHHYDLVFTTARTALEAMAAGTAVIAAHGHGLAGLVTSGNVADWRDWNFGRFVLARPLDPALIAAEIDRYDAADAVRVRDFIRRHNALDGALDRLEAIYTDAVADHAPPQRHAAETDGRGLARAAELSLKAAVTAMLHERENNRNAVFTRDYLDVVNSRTKTLRHLIRLITSKTGWWRPDGTG